MDDEPLPSILAALAHGRQVRTPAPDWIRKRAQVLSAVHEGLTGARFAQVLALDAQQLIHLIAEACDAVLRGGRESVEADEVCADTFRRWCDTGDIDACERLHHGSSGMPDA